jgi:YesN/AraC family two-component response regulator
MDQDRRRSQDLPTTGQFLLVDDEPAVIRGLRRVILAAHPEWRVTHARDGEQALCLLAERQFHAVVADLQMPTMDGLTLLRNMIRHHPETIRIVHSSHIETLGTELVRYLAHNVLAKPAGAANIVSVLAWALETRGQLSRQGPSSAACA